MRIGLAQLNPIVGDLEGNSRLIIEAAAAARAEGAELTVVPELAVSGYPPKDLLQRQGFVAACDRVVDDLARQTDDDFGILLGHPSARGAAGGEIYNAASLLWRGQVVSTIHKMLLPNYDVFDEKRYFQEGTGPVPITFKELRLGAHICEDAWWGEPRTFYHLDPCEQDPIAELAQAGVDLFINLSASPFEANKPGRRQRIAARHVVNHERAFLFVNQVGGNDDLVFDGHSFVMADDGSLIHQSPGFETNLTVFDTFADHPPLEPVEARREQQLHDALVLGLRDYMRKSGFSDCVLGLSGGIDSALAACVAAEAVGPQHVHGLVMPSRHSSEHSVRDALSLARNLGIDHEVIPLNDVHRAYEALPVIGTDLSSDPVGLADQNLQARVRGAIVMTRSNRHGWMALATGNKSELAVGYCTLYGDMCGGFAVLSDLYKQDVYAVARYANESAGRELVPQSTLEKAPSAELAPGQFDQDTLPPYPVLDAILEGLIDRQTSPAELAESFPLETVRWVVRRLDRNEFKRRQMPPGIKLSQRAFGTGRRMPMAARAWDGLTPE